MCALTKILLFFFSSRRRHTRLVSDWSSDVCSSDLCDQALRHVVQLVRNDRHVAGVPPKVTDEERGHGQTDQFEATPRSSARVVKQERHADVLILPEGVGETEERARRKAETGEVVVRIRGEAEFAGCNLRG